MRRQWIGLTVGACVIHAMLLTTRCVASPTYTIVDLGVGVAYGVNEQGQVTGLAGSNSFQAFSYLGGVKTVFGASFGRTMSRGWALSDSGVIVGTVDGVNNNDAFRWQNGSGTRIPLINGYAINNAGAIVGDRFTGTVVNAAIWSAAGQITDLGTLGGNSSRALGINNAGKVVGVARDKNGVDHASTWSNGALTPLDNSDRDSIAQDINIAGQIIGTSKLPNGRKHATLWQSGQAVDLDTLNSIESMAFGINDAGTIVGYAGFAFIYQNGKMQLLTDLVAPNTGWDLRTAYDINNAGLIVGTGDFQGARHAFLLVPVVPLPPATGEAIFLLACIGLYKAWKSRVNPARFA